MYCTFWKVYQMYTPLLRSRHVDSAYIIEQGGILLKIDYRHPVVLDWTRQLPLGDTRYHMPARV